MLDFFEMQDSDLTTDKANRKVPNVIYEDTSPEVYIILDFYANKYQVLDMKREISRVAGRKIAVKAIYVFKFHAQQKEILRNQENFFLENSIDLKKHIPEGSKIVSFNRAMNAITICPSLNTQSFYDTEWNKTYFYDPHTKSWVFPNINWLANHEEMDAYGRSSMKKTWESFFFKHQIKLMFEEDFTTLRIPKIKRVWVEDCNSFLKEHIGVKEKVAWDLETEGLHFEAGIICLSLSFDGKTGYYLPWEEIDLDILREFLKDKFLIGANIKFDWKFLMYRGITDIHIEYDTLNAGHCLNELRPNSLESHGWVYTYYGGHEIPLKKFKRRYPNMTSYRDIPPSVLFQYAVDDAVITYQTYEAQEAQLKKDPKLRKYVYEEVFPNLPMYAEIELGGLDVDWNLLNDLTKQTIAEIEGKKQKIFDFVGFEFNLNSGEKLGDVLKNELNFPDLGMTRKDGRYKTNEKALKEWSKMGYELADLILDYKEPRTFLNTFIGEEKENNAYWKYKSELDKINPSYMVNMADSHRNKCKSPNLQQAPKHGTRAKQFRPIFTTPSKEYYLAEGDYSGFQLRIAGVMSEDEGLIEAFMTVGDPHSVTARNIFHPYMEVEEFIKNKNEEPYKSERSVGKSSNFQFLFGGKAFAFTEDVIKLSWSEAECLDFIKKKGLIVESGEDIFLKVGTLIREEFFRGYPKLITWHETCHQEANKYGYIRCEHGARRLLPQLKYLSHLTYDEKIPEDRAKEKDLINISVNTRVQNFEIVIIHRGMRKLHKYLKEGNFKSRIIGMIHDAVIMYIYKDEEELLKTKIPAIMEEDYPELKGMKMIFEGELADPRDEENPTIWGFGKHWFG